MFVACEGTRGKDSLLSFESYRDMSTRGVTAIPVNNQSLFLEIFFSDGGRQEDRIHVGAIEEDDDSEVLVNEPLDASAEATR